MPPRGNSVRAGGAFVDITARIARQFKGVLASVRRQFAKLSASLNRTANRIGAAAASALAPIALLTKQFASLGDEIGKTAKRTGFSTQAISRLKFAAEQSGSSITELEAGLKRMARFLIDTEDGLTTNVRGMKRLSLELSDFQDLNPEEQFLLFADRINKLATATEKAAVAQIVFGRAGTKLIPLFNEGADGIRNLGEQAERLGFVLDKETTQAAEDMTDGFNRLKVSLKAVAVVVGKTLAGDVEDMTERIVDAIARVREWIKDNGELIRGIVLTALKAVALAAALKVVAIALGLIAAFLTPMGLLLVAIGLIASRIPAVQNAFAGLLDISKEADDHLTILDNIELAWSALKATILGFVADVKEGLLTLASVVSKSAAKAAKEAAVRSAEAFTENVQTKTRIQGRAIERKAATDERRRKREQKALDEQVAATVESGKQKRFLKPASLARTAVSLAEAVGVSQSLMLAARTIIKGQEVSAAIRKVVAAEQAATADLILSLSEFQLTKPPRKRDEFGRITEKLTPEDLGPQFVPPVRAVAEPTLMERLDLLGTTPEREAAQEAERKRGRERIAAAQLEVGVAIGTFSGRFAAQLVGGQRIQKRQLDVATESGKTLKEIERNTAGGARFAAP